MCIKSLMPFFLPAGKISRPKRKYLLIFSIHGIHERHIEKNIVHPIHTYYTIQYIYYYIFYSILYYYIYYSIVYYIAPVV